MEQLIQLGFSEDLCKKALEITFNDPNYAGELLFSGEDINAIYEEFKNQNNVKNNDPYYSSDSDDEFDGGYSKVNHKHVINESLVPEEKIEKIDNDNNTIELVQAIKEFLLSPKAATEKETDDKEEFTALNTEEMLTLVRDNIPNVDSILDRTGSTPITHLMSLTYQNGLPLYKNQPAIQAHTIHAIHYIFHKIAQLPDQSKKRPLQRICDAFKACQAEQGRVVDSIYGSLSGRDKDFAEQILAIVDEQKDQVLERSVNMLNPDAWKQNDDIPHLQVPHIQSSYRIAIGDEFGIRGIRNAKADYCAFGLTPQAKNLVKITFERLFSIQDLLDLIVFDVNQQEADAERVIDRDALGRWAGDKDINNDFDSYSIYYDEEKASDYKTNNKDEVIKPLEENEYQPFLSCKVVLSILEHVFLKNNGNNNN